MTTDKLFQQYQNAQFLLINAETYRPTCKRLGSHYSEYVTRLDRIASQRYSAWIAAKALDVQFDQQMKRLHAEYGQFIFSDSFIAHYRSCFLALSLDGKRAFLQTIANFGKHA